MAQRSCAIINVNNNNNNDNDNNNNKSLSGDEIPERTWRIILTVYLSTTEQRHKCGSRIFFQEGLTHISYIFNGRRFTKSTFRVSLLSTFPVFSINYSPVCSLLIHTGSSANVEGPRTHCQLNSCKMLRKCSTNCIWKSMQPIEWPWRPIKWPIKWQQQWWPWMTLKVIQGNHRCCHLIGHIRYPINLPLKVYLYFASFSRY